MALTKGGVRLCVCTREMLAEEKRAGKGQRNAIQIGRQYASIFCVRRKRWHDILDPRDGTSR